MKKIKFLFLSVYWLLLVACQSVNTVHGQSGWFLQNSGTTQFQRSVYFTDVNTGYVCGVNGYMLKTTNGGNNWSNQFITSLGIYSVYFTSASTGITGGGSGNIFKTTNSGTNWIVQTFGTGPGIFSIHFPDVNTGYVAGANDLVRKTTDAGSNWVTLSMGVGTTTSIFFTDANTGYRTRVEGGTGRVDKTTNGGFIWTNSTFINSIYLGAIRFVDMNTGYAVGESGTVRKTTNAGGSWLAQSTGSTSHILYSVYFIDAATGYAVGAGLNLSTLIVKTTNGGNNWTNQSPNYNLILLSVYFIDANTGYAVGQNGVIFKTTTGGVTGIHPISNEVPTSFKLYQNYPNPFNPNTNIKFDVASNGRRQTSTVRMIIYDILGREVAMPVNEKLNPGTYEVDFDGTNYPSGIYYYRLSAGEYTETKRMALVK